LGLGNLKGKQIAIPWRGGAWAVYVNATMFEDKGIPIPEEWTWDEFVEIAKKLTDQSKKVYGFAMAGDPSDLGTAQSWAAHLAFNGGRYFKDGDIAIASQEAVRALTQYEELVFKHKVVPPDIASLRYQDIVELFGQNRVAMWVNGPWFVATVRKGYPDVNLRIVPLPRVPGAPHGSVVSGTTLGISPKTKHPEEAWTFIKYLTTRLNLLKWAEAGGFVPPLKDTSGPEGAFLQKEPLKTFLRMEQLPNTFQVGNLPQAKEILRSLGNAIQSVLLAQAKPNEALATAKAEWAEILK
jgi:multiple sugar transport system substrate-binding protein